MSRRAASYDRSRARTQAATAATWARRAIAAFNRAARSGSRDWLLDGEDHRHEALEHAALIGDHGRTVARMQKQIDAARERAWGAM